MKQVIKVPAYYKEFSCIADSCINDCCENWLIEIDDKTYQRYCEVEGAFGERLNNSITMKEAPEFIPNGRSCPFYNKKKLCDIYSTIGEDYLCRTCKEFPRYMNFYNEYLEVGLSVACEEVVRIVLSHPEPITFVEADYVLSKDFFAIEEEEEYEYQPLELLEPMLQVRELMCAVLQNRTYSMEQRLATLLSYGNEIQQLINQEEYDKIADLKPEFISNLKNSGDKTKKQQMKAIFDLFDELEVLNPKWVEDVNLALTVLQEQCSEEEYENAHKQFASYYKEKEFEYEHLMVYILYRYFLDTVYDYNCLHKILYMAFSYVIVRELDVAYFVRNKGFLDSEEQVYIIQKFTREAEYSSANMETIDDWFLFEDVFAVDQMINLL